MTTGKERHGDADWPTVTLGDCVEINYATYTPKEAWPFIDYLDTKNITGNRIAEIQRLIAGKDKFPTRARRKVQAGDIVYSTVRPNQKHFGIMKKIPENFLASTGFAVIKGKPETACTNFIYWFLAQDHIVERLHTVAEHSTSAYPSIKPADIERLTLALPSLSEQRAIAGVLGALDDKIELNRRMNETLEAMAQAVFEDWFVRFGPTRARMEGRDPYLPPKLWSLFPDSLMETDSREIPHGWKVVALPEIVEINPRRILKDGEIAPCLDMANTPVRGHAPDKVAARPAGSGARFTNGDTLIARITPCLENGKTSYIDFLPRDGVGWGSTEHIVMRSKPPFPDEFAYCLARSADFRDFAIQGMTGTSGRQRVPVAALSQFLLPMPPTSVVEAFGKFVRSLFARAGAVVGESRRLAAARDALSPRLISGTLRLSDSEGAPV